MVRQRMELWRTLRESCRACGLRGSKKRWRGCTSAPSSLLLARGGWERARFREVGTGKMRGEVQGTFGQRSAMGMLCAKQRRLRQRRIFDCAHGAQVEILPHPPPATSDTQLVSRTWHSVQEINEI